MKTISSRELSRKPSLISRIKPGETVHVPDRKGGLVLTRAKGHKVTADEMFAELDRLTKDCAPIDAKAFLDEGE